MDHRVSPRPPPPAPTASGREQDRLAADDLRDVTSLLFAIFPGAVLDPPFDVDPVAFLHVLLGQIGQLAALVVPQDHPVPLSLLLLFPALRGPLPARGPRKAGKSRRKIGRAHV